MVNISFNNHLDGKWKYKIFRTRNNVDGDNFVVDLGPVYSTAT